MPGVDAIFALHRRNRRGAQSRPLPDESDAGVGRGQWSEWGSAVDLCSFAIFFLVCVLLQQRDRDERLSQIARFLKPTELTRP